MKLRALWYDLSQPWTGYSELNFSFLKKLQMSWENLVWWSNIRYPKIWYQRARRGYSEYDLVEISYYLGKIMAESIRDFKNTERMGFHVIDPLGVYDYLNYDPKYIQTYADKYERVLSEIVDGLEAGLRFSDLEYPDSWSMERQIIEYRIDERKYQKAMTLLGEHMFGLWN